MASEVKYRFQEKDFVLRYRSEPSTTYWPVRLTRIPPSSLAKIFFLNPIRNCQRSKKAPRIIDRGALV
jgi:hypothetical protein